MMVLRWPLHISCPQQSSTVRWTSWILACKYSWEYICIHICIPYMREKIWQNINCSRLKKWILDCKICFCQVAFCKQNGLQNKILPNSKYIPSRNLYEYKSGKILGKVKNEKYFLYSTILCLLTKAKCGETWRAQNKIFSWYHRRVTSQQFCEYFKRNNFMALHTHRESHIIETCFL